INLTMRDKKLPKPVLLVAAVLVALAVTAGAVIALQGNDDKTPNDQNASQQTNEPAEKAESNLVKYDGQEGKTALELLKENADVVTETASFGEFVDSINGVKGGDGGKYWIFYVNGEVAQVGAGEYKTKDGDKIEWRFE